MGEPTTPRRIEISLGRIQQLFNSMDPSPFHERDLDHDAEEFLVGWAQEFPPDTSLSLVLHLREWPQMPDPAHWVTEAIHNYFVYRDGLTRLELGRLMKLGRDSLVVGSVFLVSCLLLAQLLAPLVTGVFGGILRESLTIAGWVAMWRPMQIYLYDWWPIRRRQRLYQKMSRMSVELKPADQK